MNKKLYLHLINNIFMDPFPAENDKFLREFSSELSEISRSLREQFGVPEEVIYRGILLSSDKVIEQKFVLSPLESITYISFSSSLNCALDFCDPNSDINFFVKGQLSNPAGYIIKHKPKDEEVLFHWSWIDKLGWKNELKEGYYETLMNQKEVILFQSYKNFKLSNRNNFLGAEDGYQKMTIF